MNKVLILMITSWLIQVASARTMYVVEFEANTPQERSLIGNLVHLDGMNGNIVFSVLNEHDLEIVENQLPFLLGQVTPLYINDNPGQEEEYPVGDEKFYTYDEMKATFEELQKNYPQYVRVFSFGQSFEAVNYWRLTSY